LISYAELHYSDPISLKTISEVFGISAAYLGKVFKDRTGNSFSRYLNELRISKAKVLLASKKIKSKDVGRAVGFAETNYFYAVFGRSLESILRNTPVPPSKYLKNNTYPADT